MKNKKKPNQRIEIKKEEKIIITHKGSAWELEIGVDEYDDITIKKKPSKHLLRENQKIYNNKETQ